MDGEINLEFYTGDDIEIIAEGLGPDGKLISTKSYFEVKESIP